MTAAAGYCRIQILLHWFVFGLIAQQYLFRDAMSSAWDRSADGVGIGFDPLVLAHVAGGALVLLFAIWRLGLRARRGVQSASGGGPVQAGPARMTHAGHYTLMLLMPVSGLVAWFGGVGMAAQGPIVLKVVLLALIVLHVAGARCHQFALRDGTLARMRRAQD